MADVYICKIKDREFVRKKVKGEFESIEFQFDSGRQLRVRFHRDGKSLIVNSVGSEISMKSVVGNEILVRPCGQLFGVRPRVLKTKKKGKKR